MSGSVHPVPGTSAPWCSPRETESQRRPAQHPGTEQGAGARGAGVASRGGASASPPSRPAPSAQPGRLGVGCWQPWGSQASTRRGAVRLLRALQPQAASHLSGSHVWGAATRTHSCGGRGNRRFRVPDPAPSLGGGTWTADVRWLQLLTASDVGFSRRPGSPTTAPGAPQSEDGKRRSTISTRTAGGRR